MGGQGGRKKASMGWGMRGQRVLHKGKEGIKKVLEGGTGLRRRQEGCCH